jgi:type II secretory pathway component PulK
MGGRFFHNDRGVALLIVLLVTALLIALVFEFAYGTRVSLRAAVNFRDSQRAYCLARSGVKVFLKYQELQEAIPQGEWGVVPMVSAGDTELRIRWEDERGKINITDVRDNAVTSGRLEKLFGLKSIDLAVLDKMKERAKEKGAFKLLSELHEVMSDEDFGKIRDFLTVNTSQTINIYTASEEVLKSAGVEDATIVAIMADKRNKQEKKPADYTLSAANFVTTSTIYKVYSYALIGSYIKQVEAVINRADSSVLYWRAL